MRSDVLAKAFIGIDLLFGSFTLVFYMEVFYGLIFSVSVYLASTLVLLIVSNWRRCFAFRVQNLWLVTISTIFSATGYFLACRASEMWAKIVVHAWTH